jgi:alpha-L-rhamnosidase
MKVFCKRISVITGVMILAVNIYAACEVAGLRCEYLFNPLGLDVSEPRLSWLIISDGRNVKQTAYRILVASSSEILAQNRGDLWDSGKIMSDQSVQIEYAGRKLVSSQFCHWRVQVWIGAELEPHQSELAFWSMGLLKKEDWKAQWIGREALAEGETMPPPAPLLRKTFQVKGAVRRATVYLCGLGYYELLINGQKIGDQVLDPPITCYDKRVIYTTHDVTAQLRSGENVVGVELGSAWYNSAIKDAWDFYLAKWRALPQLLLQLQLEYADGSTQMIVSDTTWKIFTGPTIFEQQRVGEVYDARLEKDGWATVAYDDKSWSHAALRQAPMGMLAAANAEPIKVTDTIKPVSISEPQPGVFVFDMGQNMTGWPRLTVQGPAGTEVRMSCGELLGRGLLNKGRIGRFVASDKFQVLTYILKGKGKEVWEPKFSYQGFQYVQLEGFPGKPDPDTIAGRVVQTAFERTGVFECSEPLLNKIEHAAVWSYMGNFTGMPTDCPHREKNAWTGDAQLAVQMGLEHFGAEAAYSRWLNDLQDAQRDDGKLPNIAPTGGWGYNHLDGLAWESAYVLIPWEMYRQSGDTRVLTQRYDSMKRWIDWYTGIAKNYIINYGLGDWCPAKTQTPTALTSTAYYYRCLLVVAQTAEWLGKKDDARVYRDLAGRVHWAFNATFFDTAVGTYANGSQTALSCALYMGLVDDAVQPQVAEKLVAEVAAKDGHLDVGILGSKYLLRALCDSGHADTAWQIVTQKTAPGWGNWIERGATTMWENWNGKDSRNHIMFGDVSSWFIEYLAGIRPDDMSPGYKNIIIHPLPLGDLTYAKATRKTIHGIVISDWTRDGNRFTLRLTIPANTGATVWLPTNDVAGIKESGKPVTQAEGVQFIRKGDGAVVYQMGSGKYEFSSDLMPHVAAPGNITSK